MRNLLLSLAFLLGSVASASAACVSPAIMHDFPGTTFNMSLSTNGDGNCQSNTAVSSWAAGVLGAMANYGTSPGAVLVPGVNAFITNAPAVTNAGTFATQLTGATNNINNITGTITLPTGAATATNQGLLTTYAGGTLGAMANYGVSPGAVLVPGVNAFVTNATPGLANNADGVAVVAASSTSPVPVNNYAYGFNGSSWDRQYTLGNQIRVQVAQTVTAASAYASGNAVGGLITVANAARVSGSLGASGTAGILQNVAVNSKSVQTAQMDIFIFDANPAGSTCTDKTAFVLATADFDKVIGVISVPSSVTNNNGWFSGGTGSVGQANNQAMAYAISSGTSLFACVVTRGTPTFTATTDISLKFQMLRS